MKYRYRISAIFFLMMIVVPGVVAQKAIKIMEDQHRPQVHFTPGANWVNDPNGMVFYKGVYHLFYQYHPHSTVWGPMHWGHATSPDMIRWKEQPVAIFPDSLGTIFSGSAVVDKNNTAGFGKNGKPALVAAFTQHDTIGEKAGRDDFENQSIAYSLDEGKTWVKYEANPVLRNPGIKDFRDPKLMWYQPFSKWVMSLAVKDHIEFYSSPDFKNWTKEGAFGEGRGAHGGVWECPDLIALDDNGKRRWVLIVNINPGGPNLGSGTQYFVGDFNGKTFTSDQTETRWLDYGPDNYAGVTWSNTGSRTILLGWMSNWLYANEVPTVKWRSGMTLPRELQLRHIGDDLFVACQLVPELSGLYEKPVMITGGHGIKTIHLAKLAGNIQLPCRINIEADKIAGFSLKIFNSGGEEVLVGYDSAADEYFIDRRKSGNVGFHKDFAGKYVAKRLTNSSKMNISLVIDASSIELFAEDGLTVMTALFFPDKPFNRIHVDSGDKLMVKKLEYIKLKSIWR
ncbi:MAG: glycoside hydrolase family 32 protein [Ferruginibacter sp.]